MHPFLSGIEAGHHRVCVPGATFCEHENAGDSRKSLQLDDCVVENCDRKITVSTIDRCCLTLVMLTHMNTSRL
jgi:hypothetical protein